MSAPDGELSEEPKNHISQFFVVFRLLRQLQAL
jgi:hypothetical protein